MLTQGQKKILFLSALGGILEFYDFIVYILLTPYLSVIFFPIKNPSLSIIATLATFSVGYLVRPLGGIVFGHFGDKFGRKKTFTFSILMMAFSTLFISLIPTYATIGIAAPLILTFLRVLQGLSVSGEIPGALTYVSESMPERKGIACGIIFFALISGIVLGSLMLAALQSILSESVFSTWGWRILFIFGGMIGFFSYFMRRQLLESQLFLKMDKIKRFPMIDVLSKAPQNCLLASILVGASAAVNTLLLLFIPTYIAEILQIKSSAYIWWNTLAIFIAALFSAVTGYFSDKIGHKILCIMVAIFTVILAYPVFIIFSSYFNIYLVALSICAFLSGAYGGAIAGFLPELFDTHYRYSGIAVSYNLGYAILGGLAPLIAMLLIHKTASIISPALYLIITSGLASIALFFLKANKLKFCG